MIVSAAISINIVSMSSWEMDGGLKIQVLSLTHGEVSQEINNRGYRVLIHFEKYEKHFPKMYRDVGMAVPKTTQTRYMDGSVQATQMTTQVTPSLHHFSFLLSAKSCFQYSDNKA